MTLAVSIGASHTHLAHPKYRPDIDGLRAIAILAVVGFHAFPEWIKGGFIGVDIFFVISGYLISTIIFDSLERKHFSFIEFYSRRIKRIFPALLVVMVSCFVFGWFVLLADEYEQLGKHIAGVAGFVSNFIFWDESSYFDNAAATKPLLHLWPLGIVEQFYIVWPLLLWLVWKLRLNLLTITIVVVAISFGLNIGKSNEDVLAAFYSPQTRFWELLVGAVLAYTTLHQWKAFPKIQHWLDAWLGKIIYEHPVESNGKALHNVQALLGMTLIATGLLVITKENHFQGWWALLPTLGVVLLISAGTQTWLNRVVLSNKVLVWLGLISFPLYLWHWPLLSFARILEIETSSISTRIAAILISILLAGLTYWLIEKPIRLGSHSKAKTIALVASMAMVGFAGYYTYKNDGIDFRRLAQIHAMNEIVLQDITKYTQGVKQARIEDWRGHRCLLEEEKDTFQPECIDSNSNAPLLYLWGDTYAATLYSGLRASSEKYHFRIAQFTQSGCPPWNSERCPGSYAENINRIKSLKPNIVILHAQWGKSTYGDFQSLAATLQELKSLGATRVIVLGAVPEWDGGLPQALKAQSKSRFVELSERIGYFGYSINQEVWDIDKKIESIATQNQAEYISARNILCNATGCLAILSGNEPSTYDTGNLSPGASKLVANSLMAKIFK